ncbi:MAG TPA: carboxypeptidase regulatory-like domain-containing protein [Bryobacteraceae bacterium]|nr:carboxypeptidase regulatory-like domain-containing protein [Bryobacteraceae bacterium]
MRKPALEIERKRKAALAGSLVCLLLSSAGLAMAARGGQQQRLPRQAAPTTANIQGIVWTSEGHLGLGGVSVILQDLSTGKSTPATTTGDGAFKFLNLAPGRYQVKATLNGFEPFARGDIQLAAGDVYTLEFNMRAVPTGREGVRQVPSQPGLGPIPPAPPGQEGPNSPYRNLPQEPPPQTTGEPRPLPPIPPREEVLNAIPNRWNYPFPTDYHRYKTGEVPYVKGHWYDPFNRNKLKGDYPIFGNRTFLNLNLTSDTFVDGRRLPVPSNLGSQRPDSSEFFGRFGQYFMSENMAFSATLFHGDTAFRPVDWQIKFTPEININYIATQERGIVNADVRKGTTRLDTHVGLQEAFVEAKLHDWGNQYDFISVRVGIQSFNSDFRGFIFHDQEPGIRIFGNLHNNRYQYNAAYFAMLDKDTNSGLNSLQYRQRQVFIGNLYRQDFFTPGYTIQVSFHYDKDDPSFVFDNNNFLARPAAIGRVKPHAIRAFYYGLTGDGHIGRMNITHAFYQVLGHDTFNTEAGRKVDINAQMAALELSIDKDWLRYRASFFYASGDKSPRDVTARGFDTIFDNPNFAGGFFSFWNREGVRLTGTGVALENGGSLVPDLRSSKLQGQSNFVNPGIFLYNAGVDINITPKMKGFVNLNLMRFARTESLEALLFQKPIHSGIGADSGIGITYRPPLSENIVITGGVNGFQPFRGFSEISTNRTLFSVFANVRFRF